MKILLTAALALGLLAVPAQASPAHDAVRYASVKGCGDDDAYHPCGFWQLTTHDGRTRLLKDAAVVAREADGKSSVYQAAPLAVSGDGLKIAYLTRQGRLAVRTVGGGVRLLPGDALPRIAQYSITLHLSGDGSRLAAVFGDEKPRATRLFDTATGRRLGTVPGAETFVDFSGDGDEVLTSYDGDEGTYDLRVYTDTGQRLADVSPPQLVAANSPEALAADGRTTASLVTGDRPELVLYDTRTDVVTSRVPVKLPAGHDLHALDWTGVNEVTVHLVHARDDRPSIMSVHRLDVLTGKLKLRDRYRLRTDSYTFAACGG
ncbi:hypothetical protein ACIBG7_20620 [Nonomuraea sp. NPDC050328]|uniref:hypothetical protein n=1 Tax=Nonomuraea sp. NPDC050328 TaxID=3364361 RepID=UPI0037B9C551